MLHASKPTVNSPHNLSSPGNSEMLSIGYFLIYLCICRRLIPYYMGNWI